MERLKRGVSLAYRNRSSQPPSSPVASNAHADSATSSSLLAAAPRIRTHRPANPLSASASASSASPAVPSHSPHLGLSRLPSSASPHMPALHCIAMSVEGHEAVCLLSAPQPSPSAASASVRSSSPAVAVEPPALQLHDRPHSASAMARVRTHTLPHTHAHSQSHTLPHTLPHTHSPSPSHLCALSQQSPSESCASAPPESDALPALPAGSCGTRPPSVLTAAPACPSSSTQPHPQPHPQPHLQPQPHGRTNSVCLPASASAGGACQG